MPSNDLKLQLKDFDRNIRAARQISRNTIYRLIILSAGIVGFSVSLFSIPFLQSNLNLLFLKYSWYFFLGVIITGSFILFLEGRIRYAKTWKNLQISQWVDKLKDYSLKEKRYANLIVILTLLHPSNLIFNRIYVNTNEKNFKQRVNGLVVHKLARIECNLGILENFFFCFFIAALILLVMSFKI